jgi:N5-(carboxyethyl)ornithine synthase
MRILHGLGADVDVFPRKHEHLFREKMTQYDVVVNCVMWDTNRTDRIIYKSDLPKFKKGTLILDVSCDPYLEIETSHPTTIDDPVYEVDGVIHYAVDNTPAMFSRTVTKIISVVYKNFIDEIFSGKYSELVRNAVVIENGHILYENIRLFRERRGLFVK